VQTECVTTYESGEGREGKGRERPSRTEILGQTECGEVKEAITTSEVIGHWVVDLTWRVRVGGIGYWF